MNAHILITLLGIAWIGFLPAIPATAQELPDAVAMCERLTSSRPNSPVAALPPLSRYFVLVKKKWQDQGWAHEPRMFAHFEHNTPTDIDAVVCVEETTVKVGTYSSGSSALQYRWNVWVGSWPSGELLGVRSFDGGRPPFTISGGGPGWGSRPEKDVYEWLLTNGNFKHVALFRDAVVEIAFSADGLRLGVIAHKPSRYSYQRYEAALWDVAEARRVSSLEVDGNWPYAIDFEANVGVISASDLINVYDLASESLLRSFPNSAAHSILVISVSSDRQLLAAAGEIKSRKGGIMVWDISTGQEVASFDRHRGNVRHMRFVGTGTTVASVEESAKDPSIQLWHARSGILIGVLKGHRTYVTDLAASKGSTLLASSSRDGTTRVWDTSTSKLLYTIPSSGRRIALSSDGKLAAIAEKDEIQLWNVQTATLLHRLKGHLYVTALAFSPDGKTLASGGGDGTVRFWNVYSNP